MQQKKKYNKARHGKREKRREKMKVYTLTELLPPGYWCYPFDLVLGLLDLLLDLDWILENNVH